MSTSNTEMWHQADGIELCRLMEPIFADAGCHVALTGGLLYRDGPRKDCDIIVYRAKSVGTFSDTTELHAILARLTPHGLIVVRDYDRVVKCLYKGRPVDLILPERDGEYSVEAEEFNELVTDEHELTNGDRT